MINAVATVSSGKASQEPGQRLPQLRCWTRIQRHVSKTDQSGPQSEGGEIHPCTVEIFVVYRLF